MCVITGMDEIVSALSPGVKAVSIVENGTGRHFLARYGSPTLVGFWECALGGRGGGDVQVHGIQPLCHDSNLEFSDVILKRLASIISCDNNL